MLWPEAQRALATAAGEIRSDRLTRQLYATDASIYRIEPLAVGFPRTALEAAAMVRAAAQAGSVGVVACCRWAY